MGGLKNHNLQLPLVFRPILSVRRACDILGIHFVSFAGIRLGVSPPTRKGFFKLLCELPTRAQSPMNPPNRSRFLAQKRKVNLSAERIKPRDLAPMPV